MMPRAQVVRYMTEVVAPHGILAMLVMAMVMVKQAMLVIAATVVV